MRKKRGGYHDIYHVIINNRICKNGRSKYKIESATKSTSAFRINAVEQFQASLFLEINLKNYCLHLENT